MCPDIYLSIKLFKYGCIQILIFQLKNKNLEASRFQLWTHPDFKFVIVNLKIWTCPDIDSGLQIFMCNFKVFPSLKLLTEVLF